MGKYKYLWWTDLESTGSKTESYILEWAWIITEARSPFDELSCGSLIVEPADPEWESQMDDFVRNMHTENGLLADIHGGKGVSIEDAEDAIISQMSTVGSKHDFLCAGSGVSHFDRRLITFQAERVSKWLQYPNLDVGVIRRAFEMIKGGKEFADSVYGANIAATSGTKHRAMDDIRDHLNEARVYAQFLEEALHMKGWVSST